jgi:hypothetical protein
VNGAVPVNTRLKDAELPLQISVVPLIDAVGNTLVVISTSSKLLFAHSALSIVQRKVFKPAVNPVTVLFGSDGSVTVAPPAITLQLPVPTRAVLPASVAVLPNKMFDPFLHQQL